MKWTVWREEEQIEVVGIVQQVEANRGVKRPKVFCFFIFLF